MRKYWFLFKVAVQNRLADRANFYLEIAGSALVTFAVIAVWSHASSRGGLVSRMDTNMLVVYFVAAGALMGLYRRSQGDEIADDIYQGNLSFWLVKPVNPLLLWMIRDFAIRCIELPFIMGISAILLSAYHVWGALSFTFGQLMWFAFFLTLASCLHALIFTSLSLLAFWLDQTWGERFVLNVVLDIASGAIVPIAFFPSFWQNILLALPFSYLVAIPVEFLLGLRTASQSGGVLAILGLWIVMALALIHVLWRKGVRRYEGVGM